MAKTVAAVACTTALRLAIIVVCEITLRFLADILLR